MANDLINHIIPDKNLKGQGSESFQVDEQVELFLRYILLQQTNDPLRKMIL